jgi:hypothetical protein
MRPGCWKRPAKVALKIAVLSSLRVASADARDNVLSMNMHEEIKYAA